MMRTKIGRLGLLGLVMAAAGCSSDGSGGDAAGSGSLDTAAQDLAARCSGQLSRGAAVQRGSGLAVPFTCLPDRADQSVRTVWLDERGNELDMKKVRQLERARFTAAGKIDRGLDAVLRQAPEQQEIEASVWYAVDLSEVPSKDEQSADPNVEAAARQLHRERVTAAGRELSRRIAGSGAGVTVLTEMQGEEALTVPVLTVRGTPEALRELGRNQEGITIVTKSLRAAAEQSTPQSDAYYYVDAIPWLWNYGATGAGITVAVAEPERPDVVGNLGMSVLTDIFNPTGPSSPHPRQVLGLIKNTVPALHGGTAAQARTISANYGPNPGDVALGLEPALNWALAEGASVVNLSVCLGSAGPGEQDEFDRYFDYLAVTGNYLTFVTSAGNAPHTDRTCNNPYNGLVVGGADDHGVPSARQVTMAPNSAARNYLDSIGRELPHLVAPSLGLSTVGLLPNSTVNVSGTSFSAPQVSGVVASLQSIFPVVRNRPELMMATLLVAPARDVDGVPLDLEDGVDDLDGAGLLNGARAYEVLSHAYGGVALPVGHDAGVMGAGAGDYVEQYSVTIPSGGELKFASVVMSQPDCTTLADCALDTDNPFPNTTLRLLVNGTWVAATVNLDSNYQYLTYQNTTAAALTGTVEFRAFDFNGVANTFWAVGWHTGSCEDAQQSGDETDVDCGGSCGACAAGQACIVDADCLSESCTAGICDPLPPSCGNGVVEAGEACDDGNTTPGDGCSPTCQLEPVCGNGVVENGETCDDGNTTPGDGCSATCQLEPGCGNGVIDPGETCDDGNTTPGDGCSATCQLEPGCGNGIVEAGETCDDGNTTSGDGCSATCQIEPICGNGIVEPGEQCDDGNTTAGDGCSATCQVEPCDPNTAIDLGGDGNETTVPNNACVRVRDAYPSWWGTRIMLVQNPTGTAYPVPYTWSNVCTGSAGSGTFDHNWDDQRLSVTSSSCATVIRLQGNGTGTIRLRYYDGGLPPGPVCGNGVVETGEQCDDGNTTSGDGCSATCQSEPASTCTVATATDLGAPGTNVTVPNNGCLRVTAYPDWWNVRAMQLQNTSPGSYPVPFTWTTTCAGSGSGTFTGDFQSFILNPTNEACPTLIDLNGSGSGNITIRYFGQ